MMIQNMDYQLFVNEFVPLEQIFLRTIFLFLLTVI